MTKPRVEHRQPVAVQFHTVHGADAAGAGRALAGFGTGRRDRSQRGRASVSTAHRPVTEASGSPPRPLGPSRVETLMIELSSRRAPISSGRVEHWAAGRHCGESGRRRLRLSPAGNRGLVRGTVGNGRPRSRWRVAPTPPALSRAVVLCRHTSRSPQLSASCGMRMDDAETGTGLPAAADLLGWPSASAERAPIPASWLVTLRSGGEASSRSLLEFS